MSSGECAYKWGGFDSEKAPRRVTLGKLFWLAEMHGWLGWRKPKRTAMPAHGHPHLNARKCSSTIT